MTTNVRKGQSRNPTRWSVDLISSDRAAGHVNVIVGEPDCGVVLGCRTVASDDAAASIEALRSIAAEIGFPEVIEIVHFVALTQLQNWACPKGIEVMLRARSPAHHRDWVRRR